MPRPTNRVSKVVVRGPLEPFADAYREELHQRGYTPRSVVNELRQVARLSRWLESRGLVAAQLDGALAAEFLAFQRAEGRHRSEWSRPGLRCLLHALEELGELETKEPISAVSPTDELLASFATYLLSERALAPGTVRG